MRPFLGILLASCMIVATAGASQAEQKPAASASPSDCFWLSEVSGFNNAGPNQIYVHTGPREVYLFKTFGPCPELDNSEEIGFDQTLPGGRICNGMDVDLIVRRGVGPQRCPVAMVRKLSPEQARRR